MTTALWIAQLLLALMFGVVGLIKLSQPKEKLAGSMAWVKNFSAGKVRLIGTLELLAALTLLLSLFAGVLASVTAWAAVLLALMMIGAAYTHARRKEPQMILVNLILFALAAFVASGRLTVEA